MRSLVAVSYSAAAAAFFWLFTFAQRFRCASAMACLALALSLRRGLASEDAEGDALFAVLRVVALLTPPRRARAWRKRAISSSMAFNMMWSFKGDSFRHGGRTLGQEYQVVPNRFIWELPWSRRNPDMWLLRPVSLDRNRDASRREQ